MPFAIPEFTDVFGAIGKGIGALSVKFAIPPFTGVFVASVEGHGAKAVVPITALRTRRQRIPCPHTSKKHGNRQAECGGQAFHAPSLAGFDSVLESGTNNEFHPARLSTPGAAVSC